jgi:hypothetical protein
MSPRRYSAAGFECGRSRRGHYHCKHEPCWYVVRKGSTASCRLSRIFDARSPLWPAGFRFQIFVDLPQRRLRMVADPGLGDSVGIERAVRAVRRIRPPHIPADVRDAIATGNDDGVLGWMERRARSGISRLPWPAN